MPYLLLHRFRHCARGADQVSGLRGADIEAQLLSTEEGVESAAVADVNHHLPVTGDIDGHVCAGKGRAMRRGHSTEQSEATQPCPGGLIPPLEDIRTGEGFTQHHITAPPAPQTPIPPSQAPPVAAAKAGTLWKRTGLPLRRPSHGTKAVTTPQGQRRRTGVSGQRGAATSP